MPGFPIPISGGEGDGSTFFLCENFVAANAFDALMRALPVGDGTEHRAFFYVTFLGASEAGRDGGVTLVIPFDMMLALLAKLRPTVMKVPMELRGTGPVPGQVDPFAGWLE